uniref:Unnamed protein product n=1 Tax=Macaca fascicularis TaxID=9541 RepID=Q9N0C0_MACFA|nr:unnamed protein product [Macaca fascicularis]
MMAASGRGIRGKGGREGAGAGAPLESAGSEGDRAAGARRWRAGEPRGVGGGERRPRREEAPRGGRGGGLAGWKARGREPGWRACASPGRGEGGARGRELPGGGAAGASSGARGAAHTGAVSSRRETGRESSR